MNSVHLGRATLEIVRGDIAAQAVDAVVNAANDFLWMGSGVAGALKRAGGEAIEREAMAQGPIEIGTCVMTTGGSLPAKKVIHAAVMGQDLQTSAGAIRAATRNALMLASYEGLRSIALPAFGTGVGGFHVPECAKIMIDEIIAAVPAAPSLTLVRIVLFDEHARDAFAVELARRFSAHAPGRHGG